MSIDPDDVTAPYLQLAAILRERITSGEIEPGRRLPSVMELEATYHLNPKTVRKALGVLVDEGLIVASPGRGMFVKAPDSEPPASHGAEETGGEDEG